MNVLLYRHKRYHGPRYKTLLGFLFSEESPDKEMQVFRLMLVLYRVAIFCLICLPDAPLIAYKSKASNAKDAEPKCKFVSFAQLS